MGLPKPPAGTAASGRVVQLRVGQGDGFIRTKTRDVYFHRADLDEGTAFNALHVGDRVTFALVEDAISGARAIRVARVKRA